MSMNGPPLWPAICNTYDCQYRKWTLRRYEMPGKGKVKDSSGNPQGWSKGKKTGWQGAEMPPGQSREAGSYAERDMVGETTQTQRTELESDSSDQSQSEAERTF